MAYDRIHLLQEFLHFNGKANSSYDPNDGKRSYHHQVCNFTDTKLCCKVYYPKRQLIVEKSLVLFKCQLQFKHKLTSSNGIKLIFLVNSSKGMFHNDNENSDMSAPERTPFNQLRL